ncbi:hypothetical protein GQ42DRAFT_108037, partial [Ramicandelaber brevisporus]
MDSIKLPNATRHMSAVHSLTGVDRVHAELNVTGAGIRIGIVDTGVDWRHPALGGCFGIHPHTSCKVKWGYDFVGDDWD